MNVVLTGATGLIGKALIPRLEGLGHKVIPLTRDHWNAEKDAAPSALVKSADAIIHLAGENIAAKRWSANRKKELVNSRIEGARNLKRGLDLAGNKLKIFISANAVGYFGDRGDEVLVDSSPPGGGFLGELCQAWERIAFDVPADRTLVARFGVVISPSGGFLAEVLPMMRKFGASRLSSGQQWLSWIHIEDLVEAILLMVENSAMEGAYNVVAPHPLTNAEFTREVAAHIGAWSAPPVPALALRMIVGELSELMLSSQRVLPERLEKSGFTWKFPTLNAALNSALG